MVVSSLPRPVAKSPTHNSPDGARSSAYTTCKHLGSLRTAKREAMRIAVSVVKTLRLTARTCSVWIERPLYVLSKAISCAFAGGRMLCSVSTDCDTIKPSCSSNEYLYNHATISICNITYQCRKGNIFALHLTVSACYTKVCLIHLSAQLTQPGDASSNASPYSTWSLH